MNLGKSLLALGVVAGLIGGGFVVGGFHSIDNGEYAVVKSFNGDTKIIDQPGWYVNYGTETYYPDYMTLDFGGDGQNADENIEPISVKYSEGGMGQVKGNVQVALPVNNTDRLALHEKYHGPNAFMSQLVVNSTGEALTFTAGLMESQEAYMTHRAQFRTQTKDQLTKGLYATKMETITRLDSKGGKVDSIKAIPLMKDGKHVRQDASPFAQFGVTVTQFNIQDWDFEAATMKRIAEKRDAENKVITSRARTETAEQDKKEAEAIAAKNSAIAEGKANVIKARAVIGAQQAKELAVIKAQRQVATAEEMVKQRDAELQATQLESKAILVKAKAQAKAADLKIKAGGALSAEQRTRIQIATVLADGFAKAQRPTTLVTSGGSDNGELTGTEMGNFINAMTAANVQKVK